MQLTYKLPWLVVIVSATVVLAVANIYRLMKDKQLLDPKYELFIAFAQSSYILAAPIGMFLFWLLSCNQVYHREWEKRPLLSMFVVCTIWLFVAALITPPGLTFIRNKIESREVRGIMPILILASLYISTKFQVDFLRARAIHSKANDVFFYEKSCKA